MKFVCFKPNLKTYFHTFHLVGPENKALTQDFHQQKGCTDSPPVSVSQTHHTFPWMMLQVDYKNVALPLVA